MKRKEMVEICRRTLNSLLKIQSENFHVEYNVTFYKERDEDDPGIALSISIFKMSKGRVDDNCSKQFYGWRDEEDTKCKIKSLFSLIRKGDFDKIAAFKD